MGSKERLRVKAPDDAAYDEIGRILRDSGTADVLLENSRRRTRAVQGLDAATRTKLQELGADIAEDTHYDLE